MDWELFCEEQAELCEARAADLGDRANRDWVTMAEDWRTAGIEEPPLFEFSDSQGRPRLR